MKNINKKTLILLFVLLALTFTPNVKVSATTDPQQIEILQQEILVLQALVKNYNLRQDINAPSYIVENLSDGSIILQKDSEKSYSIASVTKLMNAVISLENIDMAQSITLTDQMLTPLGQSPVLYSGLKITAENLLKATLIQSANDAAQSLSYFLGNEKFISLMNQKAKELGMQNTAYYDVHGLNPANHSTAGDLAKLVSYINQKHLKIWETTKSNNFWLPNSAGMLLKFQNVNNFYYLSDFVGGKTGYTPEAKQTFASVFNVNGKQIAITLLYSENRMADIFNILRQLKTKI